MALFIRAVTFKRGGPLEVALFGAGIAQWLERRTRD